MIPAAHWRDSVGLTHRLSRLANDEGMRGGALGERAGPRVELGGAHRFDQCEPNRLLVGNRISRDEIVEVGGPACAQQIAPEMSGPILDGELVALEPLLHALRRDQVVRVAKLATRHIERACGQRDSGRLRMADARRPLTSASLDRSPVASLNCRQDDIPPAVRLSIH